MSRTARVTLHAAEWLALLLLGLMPQCQSVNR